LIVHTLASIYGEARAQHIDDEVWLRRAGREGWIVLTKDDKIRRRPVEMEAFSKAGVRVFCLTRAGLKAEEQARHFVSNINRILQRAQKPGPYIFGVYEDSLERIWPT